MDHKCTHKNKDRTESDFPISKRRELIPLKDCEVQQSRPYYR